MNTLLRRFRAVWSGFAKWSRISRQAALRAGSCALSERGREDSNPRLLVLETSVLPAELLPRGRPF